MNKKWLTTGERVSSILSEIQWLKKRIKKLEISVSFLSAKNKDETYNGRPYSWFLNNDIHNIKMCKEQIKRNEEYIQELNDKWIENEK